MYQVMEQADLMGKLQILSDAAKYDVACTSSGVERNGDGMHTGNTVGCGICHAFTGDGRCISLLKVLMTNECIFDCKYCLNRRSNDVRRERFSPEELCTLTMEFYRRNYIEGLFLSSGIVQSPDYTMGLIYQTLFLLRTRYRFNGYIHIKGIPGTSPELVEMVGYLCDRMSVNLELPTAEGLKELAPNKNRKNLLTPMRQIQNGIRESREYHGNHSMTNRMSIDEQSYYRQMAELSESKAKLEEHHKSITDHAKREGKKTAASLAKEAWLADGDTSDMRSLDQEGSKGQERQGGQKRQEGLEEQIIQNRSKAQAALERMRKEIILPVQNTSLAHPDRYFVPAGQSTQMIIGATKETDYQIMSVTEAMYQRFQMKRVFYSAFINVNQDESLPGMDGKPELLREHRLYQADFLLRFYGFVADELLSEKNPNFDERIDPKAFWACNHLEHFPVEINKADYYTLLRVPGIGTRSARRIVTARAHGKISFEDLKKMGVVLKRAIYFITCSGRMMYQTKMEENYIIRQLAYGEKPPQEVLGLQGASSYQQMTLFDFDQSHIFASH